MPVVIFCFMFYLSRSRSRLFALAYPLPHLGTPTFFIESFGVNVGMYVVAAAHFHIY